jgi:hypothetical protein
MGLMYLTRAAHHRSALRTAPPPAVCEKLCDRVQRLLRLHYELQQTPAGLVHLLFHCLGLCLGLRHATLYGV